jgi:hypothetical protein
MADRAPQSAFVDSCDDNRGEAKTRDLNAADQTVGRDRWRVFGRKGQPGLWRLRRDARRGLGVPEAVKFAVLLPLESPRVQQNECTIAQQ